MTDNSNGPLCCRLGEQAGWWRYHMPLLWRKTPATPSPLTPACASESKLELCGTASCAPAETYTTAGGDAGGKSPAAGRQHPPSLHREGVRAARRDQSAHDTATVPPRQGTPVGLGGYSLAGPPRRTRIAMAGGSRAHEGRG